MKTILISKIETSNYTKYTESLNGQTLNTCKYFKNKPYKKFHYKKCGKCGIKYNGAKITIPISDYFIFNCQNCINNEKD